MIHETILCIGCSALMLGQTAVVRMDAGGLPETREHVVRLDGVTEEVFLVTAVREAALPRAIHDAVEPSRFPDGRIATALVMWECDVTLDGAALDEPVRFATWWVLGSPAPGAPHVGVEARQTTSRQALWTSHPAVSAALGGTLAEVTRGDAPGASRWRLIGEGLDVTVDVASADAYERRLGAEETVHILDWGAPGDEAAVIVHAMTGLEGRTGVAGVRAEGEHPLVGALKARLMERHDVTLLTSWTSEAAVLSDADVAALGAQE